MLSPHQSVDQFLKVAVNPFGICHNIVILMEIKRIMKRSGGILHAEISVQFIKSKHVREIVV